MGYFLFQDPVALDVDSEVDKVVVVGVVAKEEEETTSKVSVN